MNIVFDLDGTLIDASERMYQLFQFLIPNSNFTKEEYWDLKRNKINHEMIIDKYFPNVDFESFNKEWLSLIETEKYLNMDVCYKDTISTLKMLKQNNRFILLTARQSKTNLLKELERLNMKEYFDLILVTEAKTDKQSLLENSKDILNITTSDLFISDMGKDIEIGKKLGLKTVGITHGFMNEGNLKDYNPTFIIHNLKEIKTTIDF